MRTSWGLVCVLSFPLLARGWGAGHDTVARALAARLPAPWPARLQGAALAQFCVDNHYPDARVDFATDRRVTAAETEYLAANALKNSGQFHSDEGRGVAFALLVRALREKRPESALLWLASLSHSTADMAACNHDPIVHLATYAWADPAWNIRVAGEAAAGSLPLDLSWVEQGSAAKAVWKKRLAQVVATDSGMVADDAVLDVLLDGFHGTEVCAPHGVPIVSRSAAWMAAKSAENETALAEELSALGAWAVERVLCEFATAERLAKQGALPDVTEGIKTRYRLACESFTTTRAYAADSFAQGLTSPERAEAPWVGVVSEPTWRMNDGFFGFNDRVLAAQTVASLRAKGSNAALVDLRALLTNGVSCATTPVLIVFAQRVGAYGALKPQALTARLIAYRKAGGKLVWIGGGLPDRALCDFPNSAATTVDIDPAGAYRWCWTKLPVGTNAYATLRLSVGGRAARALTRSPSFNAGWQTPSNTTRFTPEAAGTVRPLAELSDGGRTLLVGAAWPASAPSVAYLPTYAVFPYLWTDERPSLVPFSLALDTQGVDALETALGALR